MIFSLRNGGARPKSEEGASRSGAITLVVLVEQVAVSNCESGLDDFLERGTQHRSGRQLRTPPKNEESQRTRTAIRLPVSSSQWAQVPLILRRTIRYTWLRPLGDLLPVSKVLGQLGVASIGLQAIQEDRNALIPLR